MIDSLPPSDIPALISQQTDSSRALSQFYTQASRVGMTVLNWAKHNGPELVGHFCDLVNLLASRGVEHPAVVGHVMVCNAGRFAKTTYSAFKRADAFFNRRHDEGKRAGSSGHGITAGSGGSSSSSSSSVVASSSTKQSTPALQEALSKAKRVGDNRLETILEDGSKVIFRGKHAHPIRPEYPKPVSHYNVEIQLPDRVPGSFQKPTTNCHIIVDDTGTIIKVITRHSK